METLIQNKINREITNLKKQTNILKNLIILSFQNSEGDYKENFIKKILKKSKNNPEFNFENKKEFLKQIS